MKSILKYTLAIATTLFFINTSQAQFSKVKGNGDITTKTHQTSDYNEIKVVGFMDVKLESGTEGSITVTTDDNIQEHIVVESKNGVLTIKVKNKVNIQTKKGVHVTVPFKSLNKVSLTGSGDVLTSNTIKSDSFEVELTGKATDLEVKVTGSGDYTGKSLISKNTQVYVSGSGDASVYASKSLKARVNGSGDITYTGNPETTDKKVMGSGDIDSN